MPNGGVPPDSALAEATGSRDRSRLAGRSPSPTPAWRRSSGNRLSRREFLCRKPQITGLAKDGFNLALLDLECLRDRTKEQPAGHAELQVHEFRHEAALHQVGDLGGFFGRDPGVQLGQDLDHGVAAGDFVDTLKNLRQFADRHTALLGLRELRQVGAHPVVDVAHAVEGMVGNALELAADPLGGSARTTGRPRPRGGEIAHAVAGIGHAPALCAWSA